MEGSVPYNSSISMDPGNPIIMGAGSWGTAMALHLARRGQSPKLWCLRDSRLAERMRVERENAKYLPGAWLPPDITIIRSIESCWKDSSWIFVAVPCKGLRESLNRIKDKEMQGKTLVCLTKGIEEKTLLCPSDIVKEVWPDQEIVTCSLSGPSHAEEVALGLPTAVVAASKDEGVAKVLQAMLSDQSLRVYTSDDQRGVELAGALKNVMALAAGILDGLGMGDNAKAALVARGLAEMARLGSALKARPETFFGLAGVGDLTVTCYSRHGRNRKLGEQLGRGKTLDQSLEDMSMVAEGVTTTQPALELAASVGLEMPITEAVHRVLEGKQKPRQALADLLSRKAGPEGFSST